MPSKMNSATASIAHRRAMIYLVFTSSFKPKSHSASHHSRHSQRLERRARDRVSCVEQVLHGDEGFNVADKRARDRHVEDREAAQRQSVLVIVKLFARGAKLQCGRNESRIR